MVVENSELSVMKAIASAYHSHARNCPGYKTHKTTDPETDVVTRTQTPCWECERNMKWFSEVPAPILTHLLSNPSAQEASFQFATLVVESTFQRTFDATGRSDRDKAAGMRLLQWYQELGGKLRS